MPGRAWSSCAPPLGRRLRPARPGCAPCSAASAAAPNGWSSRAPSARANGSACARPCRRAAFPFPVKYGYCAVGRCRGGARRAAGPHRVLPASASGLLHRARRRAGADPGRRAARGAPPSPPTWRPRSTRSGMAAPGPPTASSSLAPASWACLSPPSPRGCRAPMSRSSISMPAASALVEASGRRLRHARRRRRATPTSSSTPARPQRGLNCAIACAGSRGQRSSR